MKRYIVTSHWDLAREERRRHLRGLALRFGVAVLLLALVVVALALVTR